jgi:hypothetical protein
LEMLNAKFITVAMATLSKFFIAIPNINAYFRTS